MKKENFISGVLKSVVQSGLKGILSKVHHIHVIIKYMKVGRVGIMYIKIFFNSGRLMICAGIIDIFGVVQAQ